MKLDSQFTAVEQLEIKVLQLCGAISLANNQGTGPQANPKNELKIINK